MKKVVILSPAHPLRGGIASFSERLARALIDAGKETEIFTFSLQYPNSLFPGKTQYSNDPAPEGIPIRVVVNSINPFNWLKIGWQLRNMRPDLIIVRFWLPFMGPCLGTILRLARSNGHTRTLCIADNIIPHEKRPGDKLFTRYLIRAVDRFVVMSQSVGEELRQFTQSKPYRYIPHPIYDNYGEKAGRAESLVHLQLPPDSTYLLFFGFIREYKGLDLLLKALADERLRSLPIRLIVAGEYYSNEARYQSLIDQLGVQDQLILHTKYIPKEEVRYYFGAADLIVQPYKSATQSGISQLAYHFEKPVLVTNVGGLPEIIEHGKAGYVVDTDPKQIAEAILDFVQNNRKMALTKGLIENKVLFSWSNMVAGIEAAYEEAQAARAMAANS